MSPAAFFEKNVYLYISLKMDTMRREIILILTIISLFSCGRKYTHVMDIAETQMMQAPDSSLALLNNIDRGSLFPYGMQMRHILLSTMAHDKCRMEMSADSSIRLAYDWYKRHGSKRYHMLSAYYLGVVRQSAGDNIEAVLAFREAEPLAENLEDYRQLSLIHQHLCGVFSDNYDHVRALEYAEASLKAAEKASEPLMVAYCRYDIAKQLLAVYRYDEAEKIIDTLLQNTDAPPAFLSVVLGMKARILLFRKPYDYEGAIGIYDRMVAMGTDLFSIEDYGRLALIEEIKGNKDKADQCLRRELSLVLTDVDSLVYYNDCYNLNDRRGDWKSAVDYLFKRTEIQDRITIELLGQSETHALESFYKEKLALELLRTRYRQYAAVFGGIVSIVIILSLIVLLNKKNRRLLEDMAKIQEFSEDISRLNASNVDTYKVVDSLIADKVCSLQQLSESFFSWEDEAVKKRENKKGSLMRDEIISSFRKQLNELREDQSFISTLEQSLNLKEEGVMEKVRERLPNEKELDFSILTLLFSGFSIKSISFLLRMSEASLRMRKTRYKQQFENLPEPFRSQFLENLA